MSYYLRCIRIVLKHGLPRLLVSAQAPESGCLVSSPGFTTFKLCGVCWPQFLHPKMSIHLPGGCCLASRNARQALVTLQQLADLIHYSDEGSSQPPVRKAGVGGVYVNYPMSPLHCLHLFYYLLLSPQKPLGFSS